MTRILLTALFLLTSCQTKRVTNFYSEEELKLRIPHTEKVIQERLALVKKLSLEERAANFEKRILTQMHPVHKFAPKRYENGKPGKLRMDMTGLFLSALAFKFSVTKDPADKKNILAILNSIYEADRSNGLDGFIPYKVKIENGILSSASDDTHINVYTQLFFAYVPLLKFSNDGEIQEKVMRHFNLIYSHLEKSNFTLKDQHGNEIDYSDLSPTRFSLQSNRKQLLLVIVDWAMNYSWDTKLYLRASQLRSELTKLGYENSIQNMHFKVCNLEFPTHSSSWLNLKNSFIGYHLERKDYYKNAFLNLHKNYADEGNLLFSLMKLSMEEKDKDFIRKLNTLEKRLFYFPPNPSDIEVINSHRKELPITSSAPFVKLKRELEVTAPLPFHQRPMRSYEWKLNQMRIDGNFKSSGRSKYTGIDFLNAYWMLQWLKKVY